MKTINFIIILFLILFLNGSSVSSKTNSLDRELLTDSSEEILSQNNNWEEAQFYYEEGISLHDFGKYLSAETAFLKAIKLVENSNEKEILAYSYHYLGNIESWKSNFPQSIVYHKKASTLFYEQSNLEYLAISNNQISSGFYALGEYDSTLVYYKKNIENRNVIDAKYTILNSYKSIAKLYASLYNYKEAYSTDLNGESDAIIFKRSL